MKDIIKYIFHEVQDKRLTKMDAIGFIRQLQTQNDPDHSCVLHPLLHKNTSTLSEQRFSSTFTGQEFFLADHVVNGQRMLPGVAYLEMARAAVEQAAGVADGQAGIRLKNTVWARPVTVGDEGVKVHIGIYPEDNGEIAYEIYNEPEEIDAEPMIYGQGNVVLSSSSEVPALDIKAIKMQCGENVLTGSQCYEMYKSMGLEYGPGQRGIEDIYVGSGQVLAKLTLPSVVADTQEQFVLHPSMMDSALQAIIGLLLDAGNLSDGAKLLKPVVPFALQELVIFSKCTAAMWAIVRYSEGSEAGDKVQKFDIDLCDETGKVCVQLRGFSTRILEGEIGLAGKEIGVLMLKPSWKEDVLGDEIKSVCARHVVVLCEQSEAVRKKVESQLSEVRCITLQSERKDIGERFRSYAVRVFEEIQGILKEKIADKILIQIVVTAHNEQQTFSGLSGLLKTVQLENPKVMGQMIEVEPEEAAEGIIKKLKDSSLHSASHVRYQGGKRWISDWSEVEVTEEEISIPWKDRGIYLITGGAGGLGLIFAKEITEKVKDVTLVLTGRSVLSEEKQAEFKKLREKGSRIEYRQVNVTDKKAVAGLVGKIKKDFGSLNGIIHCAGMIRDNFIIKKNKDEFLNVLEPKVTGLVNLDQASKDINLDFFILFSSAAGSLGNPGQADYATANAFMDAYGRYRNNLVNEKQRQGHTLSINWPLWKEGGMHVNEETEKLMMQSTGMAALKTETGIRALYQGMVSGNGQVMVLEGDVKRLQATFFAQQPSKKETSLPAAAASTEKDKAVLTIGEDQLKEKVTDYLKKLVSAVIKLPANRVEADAVMEKYGIDSVMVMQLTNELEKTFGSLPKTLFFEYQSIQELAGYFLDSYRDQLTELLGIEKKTAATAETSVGVTTPVEPVRTEIKSRKRSRFAAVQVESEKSEEDLDIAIIGVSGRYPGADNIQEFWKNLRDGKDCITEIPKERWDHSLYFDEDKNKVGKTYSKWGGFINGVDEFDPLFFNISPREAERMDPQERLFLECVYETLEDGGYTRKTLGSYKGLGLEGNVGVFVGVMYEEYQLYGAQEQILGRPVSLPGNPASIANRISYFCNFHGPSMALDTMCSSSLTAIHLACQSLQHNGCELAVAGGVNVSIHPNKYLLLGQGKFVSSKGRCESFGQGGDGYVPGEGVGAVLLKPLSKAIVDGDHIYGIIKATAVNHGGKVNGFTVPNPNAQAEVIGRAFKDSGVDPRTISYIEAHGTGTSLGDPIEIAGLNKVFKEYTKDKQFCAIGSAKSNIGHCESAAGIAGVTKILLQFKHHQLAPSLHSKVLNPNIDFSDSPFVVQQELTEWKRPVIEINGTSKEYPRRAGISAFGAGGSNAHVVIEEYVFGKEERPQNMITPDNPVIIVLSAKSEEQLYEQTERLLTAIKERQMGDESLADMAYTLQVGREAMEERVAIIVDSVKDLEEKLKYFAEGKNDIEELYQGQGKRNKEMLTIFTADEDMEKITDAWIASKKYAKLAELWTKGFNFAWDKLYGETKPRRISLPTYPFAKDRYWVETYEETIKNSSVKSALSAWVHPLLQQNTSTLSVYQFSSNFTGEELFLRDYGINNQRVLPEMSYLEMAQAAVRQIMGVSQMDEDIKISIKDVVWAKPIVVMNQPTQVKIELYPEDNGAVAYEICSDSAKENTGPIIHSQGIVHCVTFSKSRKLNISELRVKFNRGLLSADQCYEIYRKIGMNYQLEYQGIEKIYIGAGQVLAKLSLPSNISLMQEQIVLHPCLLDSALQATIGLMGSDGSKLFIPFALQNIEIFSRCTADMWALIRYSSGSKAGDRVQKLDIDLCDEAGNICVCIKELSLRMIESKTCSSLNHNGLKSAIS